MLNWPFLLHRPNAKGHMAGLIKAHIQTDFSVTLLQLLSHVIKSLRFTSNYFLHFFFFT